MGQAQSLDDPHHRANTTSSSRNEDHSNHPTVLQLEEDIARVKQDLYTTREMGEIERRNQEDEVYRLEMKVYKKKFLLHRRGEHAKKYMSFWEYVQIVNTQLHTTKSSPTTSKPQGNMTLAEHRAHLAAEEEHRREEQRSTSTAMVHQSNALSAFNIFSFFEAFLLRRLHIAMILKHQRAAQSDAWNGVIMFLYNKTPGIKKRLQNAKSKYHSKWKPESDATIRAMRKMRKKKLGILQRMVLVLEEEASSSSDEGEYLLSDDGDAPLVDEADGVSPPVDNHDDDDDDKGLDSSSVHSFSSRRSRVKRRTSDASEVSAPHWMRSSRSKMSNTIQRELSLSQTILQDDSKMQDDLSIPDGGNVTDDEIEKFLYPNRPARKNKRRTRMGNSNNNNTNNALDSSIRSTTKPNGLPSELVISSQTTVVSHLPDDNSSIDSSSIRTPASMSELSVQRRSVDDIKRRKRELEELRLTISRSLDGLEEMEQ